MVKYTTFTAVRNYTGVQPDHLGLSSDQDLQNLIETWAEQVSDFIDTDRNQTFGDSLSSVPPLVQNIAMRMVANMVGYAALRRETAFIRINDWTVRTIPDEVLTDGVRRDLSRIRRKRDFRIMRVGGGRNGD